MIRDLAYRVEQLERQLNNILRIGNVVDVDYDKALCRVEIGNIKTAWLKWFTDRASNDRNWWAPEIGEQVMVLSPSGEMTQGAVLPAIYQDAHPAPAHRETVHRTEYADGVVIEYDRSLSVLHVWSPNQIALRAYGQITLVGDVVVDGNLQVTGFVRAEKPIVSTQAVWPPNPSSAPSIPPSRRYNSVER